MFIIAPAILSTGMAASAQPFLQAEQVLHTHDMVVSDHLIVVPVLLAGDHAAIPLPHAKDMFPAHSEVLPVPNHPVGVIVRAAEATNPIVPLPHPVHAAHPWAVTEAPVAAASVAVHAAAALEVEVEAASAAEVVAVVPAAPVVGEDR